MSVIESANVPYSDVVDGVVREHPRIVTPSRQAKSDQACGRDVCHQAVPVLGDVDLFYGLHPADLRRRLSSAGSRSSVAGRMLFTPIDRGTVLYLLQDGTVQIHCFSNTGRKLVIGEFHPGTIFGTLALVGQGFYGVYAETLTPCIFRLLSLRMSRRWRSETRGWRGTCSRQRARACVVPCRRSRRSHSRPSAPA